MTDTNLTFHTPSNAITFCINPATEIMRLDGAGMTYKGQRIEDGGEAHRAFMETMARMQSSDK